MKTQKIRFILAGASALLFAPAAFGQSGTWIDTSGGGWEDIANWNNGQIAQNNQATAFFNTLNITADTTVNLNGNRAVRTLNFSDTTTSSAANWFINTGSSGILSLTTNNATVPTINVGAMGTNSYAQINARLDGIAGFTKIGNGNLRLNNAANNISGPVTLSAGTLSLQAAALSNATTVAINSGTLGLNTSAANAIGGTISFGGGRLQYFNDPVTDYSAQFSTADNQQYRIVTQVNRVVTYSTDLASVGGTLEKTGPGTLILNANNTYTGATTVTTGTLQVDGSTSAMSAVSVGTAGILAGRGTVNGTLGVSGILAPGDSGVVDIQTLAAGTTTWNGGSTWNFNLSSINATSDMLDITGDFNMGTVGTFNFDFMGSTPASETFTLVDWTGSTDFVPGDFTFTNLAPEYSGSSFGFAGNSLTFTVVPEPTTTTLAGLMLTAGLLLRRRSGH